MAEDTQSNYYHDLALESRKQVEKDIFKKMVKSLLEEKHREGNLFPDLENNPFYQEVIEHDKKQKNKKYGKCTPQQCNGLFITLSPEPDKFTYTDLLETFHSIFSKRRKGFAQWWYTCEQSGTDEETMGYHPHIHCLLVLDKQYQQGEPSRMARYFENKLSKYRTKSDHFLQIKFVTEKSMQDKMAYILGRKRIPEKQPQVETDKVWRKQNNIKMWYQGPGPQHEGP